MTTLTSLISSISGYLWRSSYQPSAATNTATSSSNAATLPTTPQKATSPSLFDSLVRYHYNTNYRGCIPHISEGRVMYEGSPIKEGTENKYTHAPLMLQDGDQLVKRLKEEGIILDLSPARFHPLQTHSQLVRLLQEYQDGGFIYDSHNHKIARAAKIANSTPSMNSCRAAAKELIPGDFIFKNGTKISYSEFDDYIGTKTYVAMLVPVAHSTPESIVHSFLIRQTAYGRLGLGKVVQFGRGGLEREFFLEYAPNSRGPFFDQAQRVIGIERRYTSVDGKLTWVSEKQTALEDYMEKDHARRAAQENFA